ncbi:uncharacterized protein TNCV_4571961 [Trichonephila clavipes]|nr:uncharacterized protein TNCV_4571961 [Trichonephila clavipes]
MRCGLPPFWKSNVRLWIAQCDHVFTFSGISSDDTKYSALVANLDADETLSYVSDIVLSPPNSDKHHTLSQRSSPNLATRRLKIKKLLTDLQLGDEKPSHLLRKMKKSCPMANLRMTFCKVCGFKECHNISRLFYLHPQSLWINWLSSLIKFLRLLMRPRLSVRHNCSSTIPVIFMQCSANHGLSSLSRQADQELSLQVAAELTRERKFTPLTTNDIVRPPEITFARLGVSDGWHLLYHRRYKEQARSQSITPDGIKPFPDKVQAVALITKTNQRPLASEKIFVDC